MKVITSTFHFYYGKAQVYRYSKTRLDEKICSASKNALNRKQLLLEDLRLSSLRFRALVFKQFLKNSKCLSKLQKRLLALLFLLEALLLSLPIEDILGILMEIDQENDDDTFTKENLTVFFVERLI